MRPTGPFFAAPVGRVDHERRRVFLPNEANTRRRGLATVPRPPACEGHRKFVSRHYSPFAQRYRLLWHAIYHFAVFARGRLRRRTPGPPPFSSMNAMRPRQPNWVRFANWPPKTCLSPCNLGNAGRIWRNAGRAQSLPSQKRLDFNNLDGRFPNSRAGRLCLFSRE
jgi:hypothetical protein